MRVKPFELPPEEHYAVMDYMTGRVPKADSYVCVVKRMIAEISG